MIQQLRQISEKPCSELKAEPVVLCAADDNYVKPLAVTLHSAAQNIRVGNLLSVIVLDGGISETNWSGLKESLADLPIELYSIRPNLTDVEQLGISHHITHTAYLRLLAGRLLPKSIDKVIYLDSDVLVCDDLSDLWELTLGENFALAVPDIACPFVDSRHVECNFAKSSPYMASISPIGNWKQLGLDPSAPYFNSGVMVLNIKRMREERIEDRLLDCLHANQRFVWCWDQYALNVVFAGQWKPLPLKWNQGAHIFEFPNRNFSPLNSEEFDEAKREPSIIHFTTEWKPWDFESRHPFADMFFQQLDQTAWAGWRPKNLPFSIHRTWQKLAAEVVKQSIIHFRKAVNLLQFNRNRTSAELLPHTSDLRGDQQWCSLANSEIKLKKQLTIFAIPKPFIGDASVSQRNAINSWKQLAPFTEVILLGNEDGVASFADELGVRHIANVETNQYGTPLISSAFALAHEQTTTPYLAYCNCDVIFSTDFVNAITRLILNPDFDQFVAIGQRTNVKVDHLVNFDSADEANEIRKNAAAHGKRDSIVCKDFFVFPRSLFCDVPDFAVGRGNWDNWMVHEAKNLSVPVVSISDCVLAIHQFHDYPDASRFNGYVNGIEARQNQELAEGRHLIRGSTCDYRLDKNSLRPGRMQFVAGEFWMDFPRFASLLMDFIGLR